MKPEHAGATSGVLATMQNVGTAIGVAVIGVVFYGAVRSRLRARLRAQRRRAGGDADSVVVALTRLLAGEVRSMIGDGSRRGNPRAAIGPLLRDWRRRRRLSQLELALEAGVSTRHLSFVETGRSQPSPEMVLHLADQLEVPLRERNQLLLAAGYAPRFGDAHARRSRAGQIRDALGHVLAGHEPYPAFAVDRRWNLVASNSALGPLLEGVAAELLVPPVNCMRLALHPDGLAPRILNLGEWRGHLLQRLGREIQLTGDPSSRRCSTRCAATRGRSPATRRTPARSWSSCGWPSGDGGVLAFFSTVTTFGTAVDVTVSELSVEAFFPADAETAERLRSA